MQKRSFGFMIPEFPQQTHIAWWRVSEGMRLAGVDVHLLSTRRPTQDCPHPQLREAAARTTYLWPPSAQDLRALPECARHLPEAVRYLASLQAVHGARARAKLGALLAAAIRLRRVASERGLNHVFVHSCADAAHVVALCRILGGPTYAGGTLFNAFVDVSAPSKWGSWGALRHLTDENPRWDALAAFNEGTPGWWESRQPDAFLHGVMARAAPGGDRIEGTAKADILIGNEGDDLLVGGGGSDRLHGGSGDDAAILSGRSSDYIFDREGDLLTATAGHEITTICSVEMLIFSDEADRRLPTVELR